MIQRIYAIALNTFREAIRNRILYAILAIVVGYNLFSIILSQLSMGQESRVTQDVGLSGVSLFGSITAIVLGVSLLYGEMKKRTVHTILSKPLSRPEFVLGKYLGMVATLLLFVGLFAIAFYLVLRLQNIDIRMPLVKAVLLASLEVAVVAAVAMFFSSFSSPFLAGAFTSGIFFLGRVTDTVRMALASNNNPVIDTFCNIALFVVPDLFLFSPSGRTIDAQHYSIHGDFVTWSYMGIAGAYAAAYIAVLLIVASAIFARRDFL